jgi:hypothetical protein
VEGLPPVNDSGDLECQLLLTGLIGAKSDFQKCQRGIPACAADNSKIAGRWKAQYCKRGVWRGCDGGIERSKQIYSALLALGANPTSEAIKDIIGNDTWCSP